MDDKKIDDNLLKKIQKLLALATSSNENESSVAAQKAQELIVKYNIDMQQVQDQAFEYQWHVLADEPYLRMHQKFILPILKDFFFVKTLLSPKWTGKYTKVGARIFKTELQILGTPTNVIIADYIFQYLSETYQRLWLDYKRENGLDEKARQAYYYGLTQGLRGKLELVRKQSETAKAEEMIRRSNEEGKPLTIADATALTVIKKDLALEDEFKKLKTTTHKTSGWNNHGEAESAGREHGKNINISRPVDHKSEGRVLGIGHKKRD